MGKIMGRAKRPVGKPRTARVAGIRTTEDVGTATLGGMDESWNDDHDDLATLNLDALPPWVPGRLDEASGHAVRSVATSAQLIRTLQEALGADVLEARKLGVSWQILGLALGISAEGARSRYGRPTKAG